MRPRLPTGIVIVGAGDQGRVVLDILRASGKEAIAFVEPDALGDERRTVEGIPVIGSLAKPETWLGPSVSKFVVGLGDNQIRMDAFARAVALRLKPVAAIHPQAVLLGGAQIEEGAVVCAGAIVGVAARIGRNVIVNTAATIDHDCQIAAHSTVGPGAHLGGRVRMGEGAYVGIGAAIKQGCEIGAWALVAGGAMVTADVPAATRVAGVPARPMVAREDSEAGT